MQMEFRYFRAPASDMSHFQGSRICSLCERQGSCFALDNVICAELPDEDRSGKVGCYDCLRHDRFGFRQATEVGYITEDGLMLYDEVETTSRIFVVADGGEAIVGNKSLISLPRSPVSEDAVAELRRTPEISTWQDFSWPTHHNDFMAYIGRWEPEDFNRAASGVTGRDLFLEMAGPMSDHFWPEDEEAIFGDNFIVFECLHCSARTAIFDMD